MEKEESDDGRGERMKERLEALAAALRALHRTLADHARRQLERSGGTVISPGEWLKHLTTDPQLAWLRSLSELMVDLDVFLDADPEPANDDAAAVRAEVERLLAPAPAAGAGTDFAAHYWAYIHDEARVAVAHGEVRQAIAGLPKPEDAAAADSLHDRHGWAEVRKHRS